MGGCHPSSVCPILLAVSRGRQSHPILQGSWVPCGRTQLASATSRIYREHSEILVQLLHSSLYHEELVGEGEASARQACRTELRVLEKAGTLGPACQNSCLCPISSTREERLGTPACPRAEAAGLEEWLRLQPSVGQRQGKEGTQGLPAPCLPPQRHGFPLTGWRSSGTAPSEQAMAGPRHKQPRV